MVLCLLAIDLLPFPYNCLQQMVAIHLEIYHHLITKLRYISSFFSKSTTRPSERQCYCRLQVSTHSSLVCAVIRNTLYRWGSHNVCGLQLVFGLTIPRAKWSPIWNSSLYNATCFFALGWIGYTSKIASLQFCCYTTTSSSGAFKQTPSHWAPLELKSTKANGKEN